MTRTSARRILPLLVTATVAGCDGGSGLDPNSLRFAQVGEIRATLLVPLAVDQGELLQTVVWASSGAWTITERISYLNVLGDENVQRSPGDPAAFAAAYAGLITQLNQTEGLTLFTAELDQNLAPTCRVAETTVIFTLRDDARDDQITWVRCSTGALSNITPAGAGPDLAASRIVQAITLTRQFTVSNDFLSVYTGSVPFQTLDRGEDSLADLGQSFTFTTPVGWPEFWKAHVGRDEAPPQVDFDRDMVVIGAVGLRFEAGDSVEVRRILQIAGGTLAEVVERVPGDFCSPAARTHRPFHIVLAPKTDPPVRFSEAKVELVPCG